MTALETLQGLLQIPSYSGEERPIQEHIVRGFKDAGLTAVYQEENVLVQLKGRNPHKAFIFNSHVDVVDIGNSDRWTHNPWGGEIVGNRIYGRGASDMKMGVAASIETAKRLAQEQDLPCDIWFTYVVKEEVDGSGTKSFADWWAKQRVFGRYQNIAAVFTEPTDMQVAQYGHRGNFFLKASVEGDAGHASRPREIKRHAIMEMLGFIGDLEQESKHWQEQFAGGEFAPPTITPTAMEAMSASPNKVSDQATAAFDLRTVPGFHQEAFARVNELAQTRGINLSLAYPDAPTGYTDPKSPIVKALQKLVPGLELVVSQGSADLGFLTELGVQGVIFGPGEEALSHVIDESAPIVHLEQAIDIYEKLYHAWANK